MPTADFGRIKDAILDTTTSPSWALEGRHEVDEATDPPRRFLAYVVGGSPPPGAPQEAVLAYQYEGPPPRPVGWRCFKVKSFDTSGSGNGLVKIPFNSTIAPPLPLNADQLDNQNCVKRPLSGQKEVRSAPYHT